MSVSRLASLVAVALCLGAGGCGDDENSLAPENPSVPADFVLIQPGMYTMGSPDHEPGRQEDEIGHEVTLTKAFYLCQHEVTQSEWEALMIWNDSWFSGGERPVERVSWFDCIEFCNRRSRSEGLSPVYSLEDVSYSGIHIDSATVIWNQEACGYRLPTEAEWEFACRGGSTTALCNGVLTVTSCEIDSNLTQVGWYCGNSGQESHDVMGKLPNSWNLFDMHGGVYEWCWDWHGAYSGLSTDPIGPDSGAQRVIRGGGWLFQAHACRSANRNSFDPRAAVRHDLGLRLSRTAK